MITNTCDAGNNSLNSCFTTCWGVIAVNSFHELLFNYNSPLVTNSRQQYLYSIAALELVIEDANKVGEWTTFDSHALAGSEISSNLHESVSSDPAFYELYDRIVDRDGNATKTNYTAYSARVTDPV